MHFYEKKKTNSIYNLDKKYFFLIAEAENKKSTI